MSSNSIQETEQILLNGSYIADTALTTALHLALALNRPLFLEGEAGVGKTEIAKVLATSLNRNLIRLQCYEGLDVNSAVFEWNYSRQMLEIRLSEAMKNSDQQTLAQDLFTSEFMIKRPLLKALETDPLGPPVLLIDELDRTDAPFEAYLLEVLSEYQITIPEMSRPQLLLLPLTAPEKYTMHLNAGVFITGLTTLTHPGNSRYSRLKLPMPQKY